MKIFVLSKLENDKEGYDYAVYFSKEPTAYQYYNQFTAAIGKIQDKSYDRILSAWKIKEGIIPYLKKIEEKIPDQQVSFPTDIKQEEKDIFNDKTITDYEHMGEGLKLSLYRYQKEIVKFCYDTEKVLLVAPCGAGKTFCAIAMYHEAIKSGKISGPALIVVKASLKQQWAKEIKKFSSYKPYIVQTLSQLKKNSKAFREQFTGADIYIVNYESLRDADIRSHLKKMKLQFVFADEVHFVKDDKTKRSKALCEFASAKFTIGATATPVQKNSMDIFGIFKFINPTLFPRKGAFGERYVKWITFGQYIKKPIGAKNEEELNKLLSPWMIIKTKEEISSQLPSLVVYQRYCSFTVAQKDRNDKLFKMMKDVKEESKKEMAKLAAAGAKSSKRLVELDAQYMMYQIFAQELANDESLLLRSDNKLAQFFTTGDKSAKTEMLVELVKEIVGSGEKVVIFSRFRRYQDILISRFNEEPELAGIYVAVINGTMSDKERYEEVYTKFNNGDYQILLSTDAGAEGLSLSNCGYLIELDLALSYAVQTQRHGRIERADSTHKTAYIYQLLTEDSYDDIQAKIVSKKENFDATIIKGEEAS